MSPAPFAEIEHPADLALWVSGSDLPSLFRHAAMGMFHLLRYASPNDLTPVTHTVSLAADDLEMLLVDWLDELLYLAHRDALCFDEFEIVTLSATSLQVVAYGSGPQHPSRIIKAVTYANLAIRHMGDGYETIITFDV